MSIVVDVLFNDPRIKCNFCGRNDDLRCLRLGNCSRIVLDGKIICKACILELMDVLAINEGVG